MAITNYTKSQGETWRVTIQMEDANCVPIMIATAAKAPLLYFAGIATKSGQTDVPIHFKMFDVETKTSGRGSSRASSTGVFSVYAYIPADEIGSCSIAAHTTKSTCVANSGTWTVDTAASLLTTATMNPGAWAYEIRVADSADVSGLESASTILEGTITIETGPIDTAGSSFIFTAPTE